MINVVFVCLGNICRSPMAEAIFRHLVEQEGLSGHFTIDSAGTSRYHIGEPPHRGTRRVLSQHGITSSGAARQVTRDEMDTTDYIVAMDRANESDLRYMARDGAKERIHLLLDFADNTRLRDVPDPYYNNNFEEVYQLVESGCRGLLAHIRQEQGI